MYWLTGILGLASIITPYLFGYSNNLVALSTNLVFGVILLVASIWEGFVQDRENWEYWLVGIAGLGAIIAPFALGFNFEGTAVWTMVTMGVLTIVAAGIRLYQGRI